MILVIVKVLVQDEDADTIIKNYSAANYHKKEKKNR